MGVPVACPNFPALASVGPAWTRVHQATAIGGHHRGRTGAGRQALLCQGSVIVPESLIMATWPAAVTDPLKFPLAPLNSTGPAGHDIGERTREGLRRVGLARAGADRVSRRSLEGDRPACEVMVRRSQLPPQPRTPGTPRSARQLLNATLATLGMTAG